MLTFGGWNAILMKSVGDTDKKPTDKTLMWGLSSAGRASALQAEGHRFEPYRPHFFNLICRSGGTGRRPGLKIPWVVIPVPVRFRSAARLESLKPLILQGLGLFVLVKM